MNRSSTFETGVNGSPLSTGDAGSPDAFNAISTAPDYSNEHPHSGTLGVKYTSLTTAQHFDWTGLGSITGDVWCRIYLYLAALPSDNNFYPLNFRTSANAAGGIIRVLASGTIQMRDSTNSQIGSESSASISTGQLIRLEARQNTGTGTLEYWLYNTADSTTETETGSATGATLGTNTDRINFGHNVAGVAAGLTSWWDDAAVSDVAKLGPYIAVTAPVTVDWSMFPKPILRRS